MKIYHLFSLLAVMFPIIAASQIADPVADFKATVVIDNGDKILRISTDLNGDGKNEVLLALKSDSDKAIQTNEPPGWLLYIANASGNDFVKSTGTEETAGTLSVGDLPQINPDVCYVGQIAELGKLGVVTVRVESPKRSEPVAKIYAFTLEGDHLKRVELGQYSPRKGPSALFKKYLTDDKRTHLTIQELSP